MSLKILVADDEPNIVISLEYLLKREGYTVRVARDGQEALDAIASELPDLVLLDVMMPGRLNGLETLSAIREDAGISETLVMIVTARRQEGDLRNAHRHGADAYLAKPFAPTELRQVVRDMLSKTP